MKTEFDNSILFRVSHAANLINNSFNQVLQPFDIGIEQRVTLEFIKTKKDATLTEIAKVLEKDKTTISRTLRVLESKGYIEFVENENDKRRKKIKLTDLGEEVLIKSSLTVKSFRQKLSSELSTEERLQLFNLLKKVINPISEEK